MINFNNIKLVATDCDGVLTDGGMYYTETGMQFKKFCVLDGEGVSQLNLNNIKTAIITAEDNAIVKFRAQKLKIDYLKMGSKDKLAQLTDICLKEKISLEQVAYIGDDIPDIPAIKAALFGCSPPNAPAYIQEIADYVTTRGGGEGCFREVVDIILGKKQIIINNNSK